MTIEEIEALLEGYRALVDECERAGHEWTHGYWAVGADEVRRCCRCAGTRRADA